MKMPWGCTSRRGHSRRPHAEVILCDVDGSFMTPILTFPEQCCSSTGIDISAKPPITRADRVQAVMLAAANDLAVESCSNPFAATPSRKALSR